MRIYLAGPMTGHEHYNALAFEHAAAQWRDVGYEVVTPFDCNNVVWQKRYGRDFNPREDRCDYGDELLSLMFLEDLKALADAEAVAVLPGWEQSKGARAEVLVALNMGKRIFDAEAFRTLRPVPSIAFSDANESILEEAHRLVHGDRQAAYSHPSVDYRATGRMWAAILERHLGGDFPDIPPRVCCLMMAAVKLSREAGHHKRDNLTDLAGYAECADMCAEDE